MAGGYNQSGFSGVQLDGLMPGASNVYVAPPKLETIKQESITNERNTPSITDTTT